MGGAADCVSQAIATARSQFRLSERDHSETRVLIRDGYCVGTVFVYDDGRAAWWIEDARLEIRDPEGSILTEIVLPAEEQQRAAA